MSQAVAKLQRYASTAVEVLYVIRLKSRHDSAKINAAKTILEYAHKGIELEDVELRLTQLEAQVCQQVLVVDWPVLPTCHVRLLCHVIRQYPPGLPS